MQNPDPRQVANSRSLLLRSVKQVWASASYDDLLRVSVFQACLNHGLARGGDTPFRLLPVAVSTVEGEVSRAGLLPRNQSLVAVLAKHIQYFRVMDKGSAGGQAVVPWLHDILTYPHPDVAALLSTMPILSQPAPPPGIPAGIAPMRKLDASAVQVPCKHFAQGACSKGDLCEYAHVQADQPRKPAHTAAVRVRQGPRETPPVDEARKALLDALSDAWPSDEYIDIFARTAAKICIQQAFVLGKTVPYEQTIVHAPNMGTHLHKCGIGMVRGTLQQMLARPEIQPFFKMTVWPKNTPPNILCLLANVFSGHPSDLVNDIVEQTYLVEPGVEKSYVLAPTIPPRSSFSTGPVLDRQTDSDSVSEASNSNRSAVSAEVVASPPHAVVEEIIPLPPVQQAQIELVMAVAQGPACSGQGKVAVVRRAINYACLSKGFETAHPDDATPQHGPFLYKLNSVPVALVSEHARMVMDNYGYSGQPMAIVLQSDDYRPYFVFGSSAGVHHVRPILDRLVPAPTALVRRILLQTKFVSSPVTLRTANISVPTSSIVAPAPAMQAEASQDSFSNAENASQASGDIASTMSRPDETVRPGVAHSVTTEDSSVPGISGRETNAAPQEIPQVFAEAQTKLVTSIEDANAALHHMMQCKWVAVGCEGQNVSKAGRLCLLQVYAAPVCFIFDLVGANPKAREVLVSSLMKVLEDGNIIKVMHDCRHPAAAIHYQLGIKLSNVFDTQVAHGLLQHMSAVTGGEVGDFEPWIDLDQLLETYDLSLPDCREFTQLQPKHWVKRPLHNNIIEYAVAGVDPLWQLGSRMMKSSGEVGVSSAIRLSKQSIQWHYDGKDKVHLAPSKRNRAVWAIGQHWQPEIDADSLMCTTQNGAEEPTSNDHASGGVNSSAEHSANARMHEEMPLLKAHGAKPTLVAGGVLQTAKKPDSLVNGQSSTAQSKTVGPTEACSVPSLSSSKAGEVNEL